MCISVYCSLVQYIRFMTNILAVIPQSFEPPVPYEAPEHLSLCLTADRSDHVLDITVPGGFLSLDTH